MQTLIKQPVEDIKARASVISEAFLVNRLDADEVAVDDKLLRNRRSWVSFKHLQGSMPYTKTFPFEGTYIDDFHALLGNYPDGACIDLGIDGWLQVGDALKLYEMAYYSRGDILQLGTHCGLSSFIMAKAVAANESRHILETVDIAEATTAIAKEHLKQFKNIVFHVRDANDVMIEQIKLAKKYALVFIDHWHGYRSTAEAIILAKQLLEPGGFILFHDYLDARNLNPDDDCDPGTSYGVYAAVADHVMPHMSFHFYCTSGCCGLYRYVPMV